MKKCFAVLAVCALMLSVAACSAVNSNKDAEVPSSSAPVASHSVAVTPSPSPEAPNPVEAAHIAFNLPAGWKTDKGEESFAFHHGDATVGGLEGLGYNDTIDGLLPNGADVESQTELSGIPVKTVKAKLSLEDDGDGKREEYHIYFFLADQKAVYDLHFDAGQVQEDEAIHIAQTAAVK